MGSQEIDPQGRLSLSQRSESPSLHTGSSPRQHDSPCTPKQSDFLISLDKEKREPEHKRSLYARLFKGTWLSEIIALSLAAICILLIVIILAIFKSRPLSHWHARITINTLINFVSQLAQTALVIPLASSVSQLKWLWYRKPRSLSSIDDFDKASRQPLDSIILAFKHRRWSVFLAGCRCLAYL